MQRTPASGIHRGSLHSFALSLSVAGPPVLPQRAFFVAVQRPGRPSAMACSQPGATSGYMGTSGPTPRLAERTTLGSIAAAPMTDEHKVRGRRSKVYRRPPNRHDRPRMIRNEPPPRLLSRKPPADPPRHAPAGLADVEVGVPVEPLRRRQIRPITRPACPCPGARTSPGYEDSRSVSRANGEAHRRRRFG